MCDVIRSAELFTLDDGFRLAISTTVAPVDRRRDRYGRCWPA